jgi:hypothetical protein
MSSELQLIKYAPSCNGGFLNKCWRLCHYDLKFILSSGNNAVFGPFQSKLQLTSEECNCDEYTIASAKISTNSGSAQAVGSSADQHPFSQVTMQRTDAAGLSVTWMGSASLPFSVNDSCTAYYTVSSGPAVLPIPQTYFSNWWTILVGCFMFFLLTCTICVYCGYFARVRSDGRKSSLTRNLNDGAIRRPSGFTSQESSSASTNYSAYPTRLTRLSSKETGMPQNPAATKVNTINFSQHITDAIPVAIVLPLDEDGNRVAIV